MSTLLQPSYASQRKHTYKLKCSITSRAEKVVFIDPRPSILMRYSLRVQACPWGKVCYHVMQRESYCWLLSKNSFLFKRLLLQRLCKKSLIAAHICSGSPSLKAHSRRDVISPFPKPQTTPGSVSQGLQKTVEWNTKAPPCALALHRESWACFASSPCDLGNSHHPTACTSVSVTW